MNVTNALMKTWCILLVGLLLTCSPIRVYGDVIAPGQRGVNYCFRIKNLDKYPDYVFIMYYTFPSYGYRVIKPNDCISFYHLSQPILCALKKASFNEEAIKSSRFEDKDKAKRYWETNPDLIQSAIKISSVSSVSESIPITSIEDILIVTSLTKNALTLSYDSVVYRYKDGSVEKKTYREQGNRPLPSKRNVTRQSDLPGNDATLLLTGSLAIVLLTLVQYIRNRT